MARPPRLYTPEEIDAALLEVAVARNIAQAKKALDARGMRYDWGTLKRWSEETHVERYEEIKARLAPILEAQIVEGARENARQAAEVARLTLEKAREAIENDQIEPKDLGRTFQQLAVGMGIHVDKTLLLEGRPTEILETRDTQQLLKDLHAIAPSLVADVESTAVDVTTQLPA